MTLNQWSGVFNVREDIFDNIVPNNVVQDRIHAPAGEWKPAPWLPVLYTAYNTSAGTDAFVISSGKVVAFDTQGYVVPAGLREALGGAAYGAGAFAATVLTYTALDYTWKTIDLVTGATYATDGTTTYTGEQVCDALIERGLVTEAEVVAAGGTIPISNDTENAYVIDRFISKAIGVVTSEVHSWSGRPEDGDQKFTNFSKQHLIMFLTEVQMQVPHMALGSITAESFNPAVLGASTAYAAGTFIGTGEYWSSANFAQLERYDHISTTADIVALGLANQTVATSTARTLVSCATSGVLTRERKALSQIGREGDWYLDADMGVLFMHADTWATLVAATGASTLAYRYYTTGNATASKRVHFADDAHPGDYVAVDAESNFRVATAAEVAANARGVILGQVLTVRREPRTDLNMVKAAWNLSGMSSASKMPGSATAGFTDLITLTSEVVADEVIVINLRV